MQHGIVLGAARNQARLRMTRRSLTTLREGGESTYLVEEGDIAWRHIRHVDVQGFQFSQKGVLDQKFFHDDVIESGRPLRPSENAVVGQRQFRRRCPDGTGFSARGRTHQPSARQSQPGAASGPERTPLGRASARRHLCRVQAGRNCRKFVRAPLPVLQFYFQLRRLKPTLQRGRARSPKALQQFTAI